MPTTTTHLPFIDEFLYIWLIKFRTFTLPTKLERKHTMDWDGDFVVTAGQGYQEPRGQKRRYPS